MKIFFPGNSNKKIVPILILVISRFVGFSRVCLENSSCCRIQRDLLKTRV